MKIAAVGLALRVLLEDVSALESRERVAVLHLQHRVVQNANRLLLLGASDLDLR